MNRLKPHKELLQHLAKASEQTAKAVLRTLDSEQTQVIGEIFDNLLGGAIKLHSTNKAAIAPYADIIRKLASRKIKSKTRRSLLAKHSQIVSLVLKALLPKLYK